MKFLLVFFTVIISFSNVQSANVLFVAPMAAYSHFTLMFRLAKEMADRGHQVTVINPYPQKTPIKNYRDVSVEEVVEYTDSIRNNLFARNDSNVLEMLKLLINMGIGISELTLKNQNVQKLLNSKETFDVVILEHFVNEALAGFAHHFEAPLILLSPLCSSILTNYLVANPAPSSYVPNPAGSFTKHMNFWQRLQNFLQNLFMTVFRELYALPKQRELYKKYIKSDIELDNILYNVSLMLTNSHISINDAVPHVPNIVEIGGYHVSPPKPLPEDLKKFLDDSRDGVVLFSMGSNLKSKDLKPEVRDALLKAFSKIKQQVLWKFEADLPEAPKNVKIMKWIPQQDVLAHPNVKAFISHGGMLSTIETVYHGVPVIGIPVYGDQVSNIAAAVNNGYGISLPISDLSEEKLTWALDEILNNPKYRENVQKRSKLMKDQPLKPIDSAIFWIEHVIRHKGAPHLRSAGVDLLWYQREMIDIFALIGLVLILICSSVYVILWKIVTFLSRRPKTKNAKKIKKN